MLNGFWFQMKDAPQVLHSLLSFGYFLRYSFAHDLAQNVLFASFDGALQTTFPHARHERLRPRLNHGFGPLLPVASAPHFLHRRGRFSALCLLIIRRAPHLEQATTPS